MLASGLEVCALSFQLPPCSPHPKETWELRDPASYQGLIGKHPRYLGDGDVWGVGLVVMLVACLTTASIPTNTTQVSLESWYEGLP